MSRLSELVQRTVLALLVAGLAGACGASSDAPVPLVLERTIPLAGVHGRIDHLAVDLATQRLFVAELGAGAVEALDLRSGRSAGRIAGLSKPQGVAALAERGELIVATGGDGGVRVYRSADLAPLGEMRLGEDADDARADPRSGRVVVGYGDGALAVIDPARRSVIGSAALPAHPEGFALDGERAFVNLPGAGKVASVDLASGRPGTSLANRRAAMNFPLALNAASGEIAVVDRLPPQLALTDRSLGAWRQTLSTCADADDVFFDARRARIYVICGEGRVDVFAKAGASYQRDGRVASRLGARTGLFVPELDRLYVAAPAKGGGVAQILVFKPAD
jgi:hypothetical protein